MRHLPFLFLLFLPLFCGHTSTPFAEDLGLVRQGKDYALFFPVSTYIHPNLTNLSQSVPNAISIARELETSFGFQTEIVPNATFTQMTLKLQEYQQKFATGKLPADGQLFIYFSGHGMREFNNGYFLPKDANPKSLFNTGLGYSYWRQFISNINCQHIMVAVDACYSVTFDPDHTFANYEKFGRKGELTEAERVLANHEEFKSRIFFSSDSKEDIVPGRSNFARKLLEGLRELRSPDGFVTSSRLFSNYVELAQPAPRAADFEGDDPSATFLFFHDVKRDVNNERADLAAWQTAQRQDNCAAYRAYLKQHPYGDFATLARQKMAPCEAEERMLSAWQTTKVRNDCDSYTTFAKDYPQSLYASLVPDKLKALGCGRAVEVDNMVFIKGGAFQMGDRLGKGQEDETPIHKVTLSDFYLSRAEVTVADYTRFLEDTGYITDIEKVHGPSFHTGRSKGKDNHPVAHVSWNDAIVYCNWLSQENELKSVYKISGDQVVPDWTANGYRLPTESEWEFAATNRGKDYLYFTSNQSQENLRNTNDGFTFTSPVGSFLASELGLWDIIGNVEEWCWDRYGPYLSKSQTDPRGATNGTSRVFRGGSWLTLMNDNRVTLRRHWNPNSRNGNVGFRLARSS